MRTLLLVFLCAALAFTGCNRNKNDDAIEALTQSEQAAQSLDEEEIFARDKIQELTDLIHDSVKDGRKVDEDVERWLQDNREALTNNARTLQAKLESKDDEERAYYEETFSVFMRPTVETWHETLEAFKEHDRDQYSYAMRALKRTMPRKKAQSPKDAPAPKQAPDAVEHIE